MIKTYKFFGESPLEFEDSKTVKELIEYAFDKFDYYEPFGMDTVTVFQCHHPKSNKGWFTTDTKKKCTAEICNNDELCFAYYLPGFFYYAEGGWGHHMETLGNHPVFANPVSLNLRFEDFDHTVVFEGTHTFREVLDLLKEVGYIDASISKIRVNVLAYPRPSYSKYINLCNPILDAPMTKFESSLPQEGIVTLILG